ncbi:MAG: hypothetical protein Q4B57_06395 [Eubacteriales bacterium]|nr:hypothetical protein [Eubacteriales bacterium]
MKRGSFLAGLLCAGLLLTGCGGRFSPEITGVSVDKKGKVTQVVRENFQEANYSEADLSQQIKSAVDNYNAGQGDKRVKAGELTVKSGVAQLRIHYETASDYEKFNHVGFYVGQITGAIQQGYAFEGSFVKVKAGKAEPENKVWGSSLMTGTNYKTVVFEEPMLVEVPGEIRYVSENLNVTGKSTAVAEENGVSYILYE